MGQGIICTAATIKFRQSLHQLSNSLVFEVFWFFGKLVKVVGFHIKATAPADDKEKQEQESGKKYSPLNIKRSLVNSV